jgi:hypothetical protein
MSKTGDKGFVSVVKNTFRKAVLVGSVVLPLTFSDCERPPDPVPDDKPPVCTVQYKSSTSGDSPLSVPLKVVGAPGTNPLGKNTLHIDDKTVTISNDKDTTIVLYAGKHSVYAESIDTKGMIGKSNTTNIRVNIVPGWSPNSYYSWPKGPVNLFVSDDASDEFNQKKTQLDRDALLELYRVSDTAHIPTGIRTINGTEIGFLCVSVSILFEYNSHDWKDLYDYAWSDPRKYGWYNEENIDSMFVHQGTIKRRAAHKAPIYTADVSDSHIQNYCVTGDDLHDGNAINFIEMMKNVSGTKVRPGQKGIPLNYPNLTLNYSYTYRDDKGRNCCGNIRLVKYNLVNGVLQFVATNPNVEVIMTRNGK